jgi:UDPglucose--hexose-1-phosphate uridylyltransferase
MAIPDAVLMSQFRKDPVTGRWVVIASERERRPRHFAVDSARLEVCPFCAGNESMTPPEVWSYRESDTPPDTPGWSVRVVPNKYPALDNGSGWKRRREGLYELWNGLGVHEVIVESPDHVVNMGMLSARAFVNILRAYRDRMRLLQNNRRWRYLLVYKNQGDHAGATLEHVHSQLVALPALPREALDELRGVKRHYASTERCIFCDIIRREAHRGERLIAASEKFVAVCPFAPRFAYETWILPKNHTADFPKSSESDLVALADVLRDVIRRLNRALNDPPLNYFIHTRPAHDTEKAQYHWHIEILPQIARAAGFEWGTGAHMNPVAPEAAARLLREVAV